MRGAVEPKAHAARDTHRDAERFGQLALGGFIPRHGENPLANAGEGGAIERLEEAILLGGHRGAPRFARVGPDDAGRLPAEPEVALTSLESMMRDSHTGPH